MPGVLTTSEAMAKAGKEMDDDDLDEDQYDFDHSKTNYYGNGISNTKPECLQLPKFDGGLCDQGEHVSTPSCSPSSIPSPLLSDISPREDIKQWTNAATSTSDIKCFTPIASEMAVAGAGSLSDNKYNMSYPQAHPDLDWDELFALTDYMGIAYKYPCFKNNNDVSPLQNTKGLTSPPEGNVFSNSCSKNHENGDLFDVFINPAAYSTSDESEERLSSVDSESTLSETDSDASTSRPRKSSLRKRPRTPPGNPSRKSVRFADALGLDLETVRHILEMDQCPSPPMTVLETSCQMNSKSIHLCFEQPGGRSDFLQRLCQQNICLENALVSNMTVIGTIKVRNLAFCKEVRVRYSWDNWITHANIMARYVAGSCDGPTDRFSFGFSVPRRYVGVGDKVFFAVFYKVAGQEYWDNNNGLNYMLLIEEDVKAKGTSP